MNSSVVDAIDPALLTCGEALSFLSEHSNLTLRTERKWVQLENRALCFGRGRCLVDSTSVAYCSCDSGWSSSRACAELTSVIYWPLHFVANPVRCIDLLDATIVSASTAITPFRSSWPLSCPVWSFSL